MSSDEIKEYLSECLDCLEDSLDILDFIKNEDYELNKCFIEINQLYEKIRLKYDK